jgi:large subunit ribosomal protein LP1
MSGDLACTYAALILHDDGQEVTADKISAVVSASGLEIEPYWSGLFAKFLEQKSVGDLISNVGAGGGGGGGGGGAAAGGDAGGTAAAAAPEEEEEEEAEMDFDLFD